MMSIQHDDLEIVAACRDPSKLITAYKGEVRVGDLRDPDYLDRLLVNIDAICHTAGWSNFNTGNQQSSHLYLEPTLELINHAIEWRVSRFINLSSLAAASLSQRHDDMAPGQPRRHWPMMNCMIAIEDYMKAHAQIGCTMVNLRLGIYSGQRMNIGLLPVLLNRLALTRISYATGRFGYFPMIDGQDIGQAFARAALAPDLEPFQSFNISGPEQPTAASVIHFLQQQLSTSKTPLVLPSLLRHFHAWFQEYSKAKYKDSQFSRSLSDQMSNPLISIGLAKEKLGYDPEVSWQASLYKLLNDRQNPNQPAALSTHSKPLDLIE